MLLATTEGMNLQRLLDLAPRIVGVRRAGARIIVLLADEDQGPLQVGLPTTIRGRRITDLEQLVQLEAERRISREDVAASAAGALLEAIENYYRPVEDPVTFWENYADTAEAAANTSKQSTAPA
jgi:hypothetical protein